MRVLFPYENRTFFDASKRRVHIDANNNEEAQAVKERLETADFIARTDHGRPKTVNYTVDITGSSIDISGKDLGDIVASIDDMHSLHLVSKVKRDMLVKQVDAVEDTPERRAQIMRFTRQNITARRRHDQQKMSIGAGSQFLKAPKSAATRGPTPAADHPQNGATYTPASKSPPK